MPGETAPLFRDDPYLRACPARVLEVNARGGIVLDQTIFYAAGGGQPGDTGRLVPRSGPAIPVGATIYDEAGAIVHVPAEAGLAPREGETLEAAIEWPRRHRHMRMHSALHLLCSLVPFPVTGGAIGADESRLDFDIAEADAVERDALTEALNRLVDEDHPVTTRWISEEELADSPGLVRTMSAKPPMGTGRVRLVAIGAEGGIDLQPCGGTHVRSTAEVGPIAVTRIEKKGRQNRRIRIRLEETA